MCGVWFALPKAMRDMSLEDRKSTFCCPNGHRIGYSGKTEAEKLRERLDIEREHSARLAADRDQIQASLSATKGQVTRLKKRVAAGVCPCCGRTFQQLSRHMANKHPGYATEDVGSPA